MFKKLVRNSTNFPVEVFKALSSIEKHKDDALRYHQKIIVNYMEKTNQRGILIYHKMGSGKTILGIALVMAMIKSKQDILFIAPKSLHANMRETIYQYQKMDPEIFKNIPNLDAWINKHFKFISLNASNMFTQVVRSSSDDLLLNENKSEKKQENLLTNLDNKIIIWDEFHNFLNSVTNGSKNAIRLYDVVMNSKNCRVIGMTGTPIINDPYELAIGLNLISGISLFGESYEDFNKYFTNFSKIKNKDKFQDRILGLVSYYDAGFTEEVFPAKFQLLVERVPMSKKQFAMYAMARDREIQETSKSFLQNKSTRLQKPSGASSSYRVRSRQISNYNFPTHALEEFRTEKGQINYKYFSDRLTGDDFKLENLRENSPKLLRLLQNVCMHLPKEFQEFKSRFEKALGGLPKKPVKKLTEINARALKRLGWETWKPGLGYGVVYSQFLNFGISIIAKALASFGWQSATGRKLKNPSFAIISGDVDPEKRSELIALANNPENKNGELLTLLLFTATGAEGISLLRGRHAHIYEPYWHWARLDQVIARIVRYKSHSDLPKSEQSTQFYIYLSDYSDEVGSKLKAKENTTDVQLFLRAWENKKLINGFLQAIEQASVDCMIHNINSKKNCRICAPTGKTLWRADLDRDIQEPSPCENEKEEKTAYAVKVNNRELFYSLEDDGLHVYEFDTALDGYREISEIDEPETFSAIRANL